MPAAPSSFFEGAFDLAGRGSIGNYDVFPDGQRFLMMRPAMRGAETDTFYVVVNWPELLRAGSDDR